MEHGGISNHCLIWTMSSACACIGQYKQVNSCLGDAEILERFFSVQLFGQGVSSNLEFDLSGTVILSPMGNTLVLANTHVLTREESECTRNAD